MVSELVSSARFFPVEKRSRKSPHPTVPDPKRKSQRKSKRKYSPRKPSGPPAKKRRRKAVPVPLDLHAHWQAEAWRRRTQPPHGAKAKGAATEPLDGGARTYGCTHTLARGPEGRRLFLCSEPPSGALARELLAERGEGKRKRRRWESMPSHCRDRRRRRRGRSPSSRRSRPSETESGR
jgi:hypothetical protein